MSKGASIYDQRITTGIIFLANSRLFRDLHPLPSTLHDLRKPVGVGEGGGGEVQAAASLQHCLTSSFLRYTQNHIAYIFTNIHPYIPAYTFIFYERLSVSGYDQNFLLIGSAKRGAGER